MNNKHKMRMRTLSFSFIIPLFRPLIKKFAIIKKYVLTYNPLKNNNLTVFTTAFNGKLKGKI
jgi:hypothetical protein